MRPVIFFLVAGLLRAIAVPFSCDVTVSPPVIGHSALRLGVTHTSFSLDSFGDAAAVARGEALLRAVTDFQNEHIVGWGGSDPEPSPGVYDWTGLDQRIALMQSIGGQPVITLCGAPDWMKGPLAPGVKARNEIAPLPEHYDDFAALAASIARHYPQVCHYQVWNEFKGFWNHQTHAWDAAAYTTMYNKVYDALKKVSPDIQVGGPYLVLTGTQTALTADDHAPIAATSVSILQYWLQHKHGADFFCVDRSIVSQHDPATYSPAQYLALTPLYENIMGQLKTMTNLPIWWSEYYGGQHNPDLNFQRACDTSILLHLVRSGAAVAILWQPQANPTGPVKSALFTDTRDAGGGQPLPLYTGYRAIHDNFRPGTPLLTAQSSDPLVEVLASPTKILLVNKHLEPVAVRVNGAPPLSVEGYGVTVLDHAMSEKLAQ